jgi:mRNA-degrading endonuclease RelE of RelBE toxin-antitoxin system
VIWTVRWTPRAAKERDRLDARVRERVLDAIQRYAESGVGDAIQLKGRDDWRLKVGKWRILFRPAKETGILWILHVLPRDKAYEVREPAEEFGEVATRATVRAISFDENAMEVALSDARRISLPLAWYPRLLDAEPEQRRDWELIGDGEGIHWPSVDEDLSVRGILRGARAR